MVISWSVNRDPNWFADEQSHRLDVIVRVQSESMVNSGWQNNKITLLDLDSNPVVTIDITDIEEARTIDHESNLFVGVQMFFEEHLQLVVVVLEFVRRTFD